MEKELVVTDAFVIEHIKGNISLRKYAATEERAIELAKNHLYNSARPDVGYSGHTMAIYPVRVVFLADPGETLEDRLNIL